MKKEEINEHVANIVENTFKVLQHVYNNSQEGKPLQGTLSRIIFPRYSVTHRDGETRLSEQELRFVFVEQFTKYCEDENLHWFYSVETPTEEKYDFRDKNALKVGEGVSAMVDLAIHDEESKRIALIEFKALNPDIFGFEKDFYKLTHEPIDNECSTFFVMFVKNYGNATIKSLQSKTKTKGNTLFYCWSLEKGEQIDDKIEDTEEGK